MICNKSKVKIQQDKSNDPGMTGRARPDPDRRDELASSSNSFRIRLDEAKKIVKRQTLMIVACFVLFKWVVFYGK